MTLVIVASLWGAIITSIVLGLMLSRYKGRISESSRLFRLTILIVLAVAIGVLIFISLTTYYLTPMHFIILGSTLFIIGYMIAFCLEGDWKKW